MEAKFNKKLNANEMLLCNWDDFKTSALDDGDLISGEDESVRGIFRRKTYTPYIDLTDRALWLYGEPPELTHFCHTNRGGKVKGGNTSSDRLCVLVKEGPVSGGSNKIIVQIRAHMPQDSSRPAGVGFRIVPDGPDIDEIATYLLQARGGFD